MNDLMDIKQLSTRLSVNVNTLRKWVIDAQIPYLKLGRLVRFDSAVIDKWLEAKAVTYIDRNVFTK